MKTVKLPVVIQNNKQAEMGVESPDQTIGYGIFVISQIEGVIQTHDDSLGRENINCEATLLQLKSGATFYIQMFLDDAISAIRAAQMSPADDPLILNT